MTLRLAGYAAVWDRVDRVGDVMRRGAFRGAGPVPLRWRHGDAVGEVVAVEEDGFGLRVEAVVEGPAVRVGDGLSVGYRAVASRQGAWRELLACDLIEVSLVPVPCQALARVERVFIPAFAGEGQARAGEPG